MTTPSTRLASETLADIQGFVTSGYGHLTRAAYLFVELRDAERARGWVDHLLPTITSARPWPAGPGGDKVKPSESCNIGFGVEGLAVLGLPAQVLCTFSPEFQEGIAREDRSRILGDTEESDPNGWELGGPATRPIHAILIVHADSDATLEAACRAQRTLLDATAGGVIELPGSMQTGYRPETDREPFGFHDGISQPSIAGISGRGVPTGEFILGYQNQYQIVLPTPVVPADLDPRALLPPLANPYHAPHRLRDLGINGSYVVYRKLQQDVAGFWQFMKREALRITGEEDPGYMVWLASRLVGRWPSGAPLVLAPDADDPRIGARDDFQYHGDADGLACPIGAHIRRTNPRDVVKPYPSAESLQMSQAHRLLRRGRAFGSVLFDPSALDGPTTASGRKTLLELSDDGQARGIHFFCVNASIKGQFEFVQQNWCNNPRFGGLNDNKDPITGDNDRKDQPSSHMTIPRRPFRVRTGALPRFVKVRAGAYLFMPSLAALRFLAGFRSD